MELTIDFKNKVIDAILKQRTNFDGSDAAFAKTLGLSPAIYSRLKKGERDRIIDDAHLLQLGREMDITVNEKKWNMARTDVFNVIEEDVNFCKRESKAMICIDDVGIGKSYAARYLARTLKNCFYIDCKQTKSKQLFIRRLAKVVGIDNRGKYCDVKENLKYYINTLPTPVIIVDDTGYLEYPAFMELLELWDATEGICGWYQIGDDSLRSKIEHGIDSKKVGYKALFSRYSKKYTIVAPNERNEKCSFYKKLIYDVLSVNMLEKDKKDINMLVNKCLSTDMQNGFGDLRRAESLLRVYYRNKEDNEQVANS
jgi:hypothetical protein